MKNLVIVPITLSIFTLLMTGCEEDDGVYNLNNNNQITVTSFDNSYDNQANARAIARIDETFSTGERDIKIKNLVNNYSNQSLNSLDKIVLANNFEGRLENKNIEVDGRIVNRPIYEKNSNQILNFKTNYRTLDLSGLKADSYRPSNTILNSRGIITDLNNYPNISVNATFPTGSVCYIPVTTSERSFLAFNGKNKTSYSSLNRWVDAAEARFSDNREYSTSRFGIGTGNNQQAAQVMFFAVNNQPAYQYNGVAYNNDVYDADYIANGISEPNTDSRFGVVDCTLVNEVAAEFLESQIVQYY